MKNMKKLLALGLTAALTITTAVPAFAADEYPYLTGLDMATFELYGSVDYSTLYSANASVEDTAFGVVGLASDYIQQKYLTEAEANGVKWSIVDGSMDGITYSGSVEALDEEADQYIPIAYVNTDVPVANEGIDKGTRSFGVVEATNSLGNSVDFTVAVDKGNDNVNSINCYFYNSTSGEDKYLGEVTGLSVSRNDYYGETDYANVLDSVFAARWAQNSILNDYEVQNYGTPGNPDYYEGTEKV